MADERAGIAAADGAQGRADAEHVIGEAHPAVLQHSLGFFPSRLLHGERPGVFAIESAKLRRLGCPRLGEYPLGGLFDVIGRDVIHRLARRMVLDGHLQHGARRTLRVYLRVQVLLPLADSVVAEARLNGGRRADGQVAVLRGEHVPLGVVRRDLRGDVLRPSFLRSLQPVAPVVQMDLAVRLDVDAHGLERLAHHLLAIGILDARILGGHLAPGDCLGLFRSGASVPTSVIGHVAHAVARIVEVFYTTLQGVDLGGRDRSAQCLYLGFHGALLSVGTGVVLLLELGGLRFKPRDQLFARRGQVRVRVDEGGRLFVDGADLLADVTSQRGHVVRDVYRLARSLHHGLAGVLSRRELPFEQERGARILELVGPLDRHALPSVLEVAPELLPSKAGRRLVQALLRRQQLAEDGRGRFGQRADTATEHPAEQGALPHASGEGFGRERVALERRIAEGLPRTEHRAFNRARSSKADRFCGSTARYRLASKPSRLEPACYPCARQLRRWRLPRARGR
jgi:hypothetical protein